MQIDDQKAKEFFKNDHFAVGNGIELLEAAQGYAKTRLKVESRHHNGAEVVQGGAIFTLADLAFAVACNTSGKLALGVNMQMSCLKATRSGTLIAEATEISRSRKMSHCEVRIVNEKNELVALFNGTAYVTDQELDFAPHE